VNEERQRFYIRGMRSAGSVRALLIGVAVSILLAGCATRSPATLPPRDAPPAAGPALGSQVGLASFYGREFHGRKTASGQRFDMRAPVAAHPSYPFGTRVRVTNLTNRRDIIVTIIDRGPTKAMQSDGVIIDVSRGAAEKLAFVRAGRQRVRVEVLEWGR
jgi:rare lipoprotein A